MPYYISDQLSEDEDAVTICDPREDPRGSLPALRKVGMNYAETDEARRIAEFIAGRAVRRFPGPYERFDIEEVVPGTYQKLMHPIALHFSLNFDFDAVDGFFPFTVKGTAYNWGRR